MELAYCDNFVKRSDCVSWVGAENGLNIKLRYQVPYYPLVLGCEEHVSSSCVFAA